jgi:hypothetical protein
MRATYSLFAVLLLIVGCSREAPQPVEHDASSEAPSGQPTSNVDSKARLPSIKPAIAERTSTVQEDYATLKRALKDQEGKLAASLVTASTLAEYETCRKLALDSTGTDFANTNQMTVLLTFQLRYLLEKSKLQKMSGRDVFEWGVSDGLVKKDVIESIEISKVQYDEKTAFATLTQNGKLVSNEIFTFRKEEGYWKLDMNLLMQSVGKQLDAIRKPTGKTKVETALFFIEKTHGKGIPTSIMEGPVKE